MQSFSGPYPRYVPLDEATRIIEQVHGGICGTHIGGHSLCHRIMTQGFYWPTMKPESKLFVKNCDIYHKFGTIIHVLATMLHSVSSPWPFYKWGIDIMGMLPLATSQRKFILVATDYFTNWAEAEAYTQVKATHLVQFVQKNIVWLFEVPHSIVPNNGPQFINMPFQ